MEGGGRVNWRQTGRGCECWDGGDGEVGTRLSALGSFSFNTRLCAFAKAFDFPVARFDSDGPFGLLFAAGCGAGCEGSPDLEESDWELESSELSWAWRLVGRMWSWRGSMGLGGIGRGRAKKHISEIHNEVLEYESHEMVRKVCRQRKCGVVE